MSVYARGAAGHRRHAALRRLAAGLGARDRAPPPDWAPVGRWFWHLEDGAVFHDDIGSATPWEHEAALGWIGHYAAGIVYGVVFALLAGPGWLAAPRLLPAWLFALVTVPLRLVPAAARARARLGGVAGAGPDQGAGC